jgi:hypothetical protein
MRAKEFIDYLTSEGYNVFPDPNYMPDVEESQLPALFVFGTGGVQSELETVINNGSANAFPVYKAIIKDPITHLDLVTADAYMRAGRPIAVGEVPTEKEQRVFWNQGNTLVGWTTPTMVEWGEIKGTLAVDQYYMYSNDYGAGAEWHGPSLKTSLSTPLQDFQVDVVLQQFKNHYIKCAGRIEIYLLDEFNNVVGKMSMYKNQPNGVANWANIRVGNAGENHSIIASHGQFENTWTDFNGLLRIKRVDNQWEAYVARLLPNGQHDSRLYCTWVDAGNKFTGKVAQIQVHMAQFGTIQPTVQKIDDIKVYKVNKLIGESAIPYIAYPGDEIEIDFKTKDIRINGEGKINLKPFGASFFPLKPGDNATQVSPFESLQEIKAVFREAYK